MKVATFRAMINLKNINWVIISKRIWLEEGMILQKPKKQKRKSILFYEIHQQKVSKIQSSKRL